MLYMLLPHEHHCDDGLGAMGDEFEESGKVMGQIPNQEQSFRLARCFLFRHAIELYLKSAIVILHRGLKIPYGEYPYEGAGYVKIKSRWCPIYKTHSVDALWLYLKNLICDHAKELETRCMTNWEDIPDGLDEAIATIDELDRTSTFFRYPNISGSHPKPKKSTWQEIDLNKFDVDMAAEKPIKMLLLANADDEVHSAFKYHEDTLAEVLENLEKTAHNLSGMHVGLRCELMGGR